MHTVGSLRVLIRRQLEGYYEKRERESLSGLLLEEYLGQSGASLCLDVNQPVTGEVFNLIESAVSLLKKHVPVQYILGKAHFCGMVFRVSEHVLIPRQETEELVGWICEDHPVSKTYSLPLRILDVGTGSGCIAVTLKKRMPGAQVTAVDISREAVDVARSNAGQLGTDVMFVQLDMLDPNQWEALGRFDIIVSNPPYVLPSDRSRMNANVTDHEPALALFVSDHKPLMYYEAIAAYSGQHLGPQGMIYLEINERMGRQVCDLFENAGFEHTELRKDIHGRDRMVRVSR